MSAQGFVDPYDYSYQATPKEYTDIDSFWGKIGQGLGFVDRNEYSRWLTEQERNYERAAINSARAWDEYMDSTKYQRMVKDLEAAGLNPWLAIQSGVSAGGVGTTASQGSSARHQDRGKNASSGDMIKTTAMLLLASAKLLALL